MSLSHLICVLILGCQYCGIQMYLAIQYVALGSRIPGSVDLGRFFGLVSLDMASLAMKILNRTIYMTPAVGCGCGCQGFVRMKTWLTSLPREPPIFQPEDLCTKVSSLILISPTNQQTIALVVCQSCSYLFPNCYVLGKQPNVLIFCIKHDFIN